MKIMAQMPDETRGTTYTDLITLQFNYFGFMHNHGGSQSTTFRAMN